MVIPVTAHPSFDKAAEEFGIEVRSGSSSPARPAIRSHSLTVRRAVSDSNILSYITFRF